MPAASADRIASEVRKMFGPFSNGKSRPIMISLGAFAAIAIAGTTIALGAAHQRLVNPDTTVSYTATTTGPVIQGVQNGTGQGVEGLVGSSPGAIGILGFATDLVNPEVALEGLAWGPSSVGLYGQGLKNTDTTHPTVGLLGTSTSGIGVEGQSLVATGTGVFGVASDGLSSGSVGVGGGAGSVGISSRGNFMTPGIDGESIVRGTQDTAAAFGIEGALGGLGGAPSTGVLSYGLAQGVMGLASAAGATGGAGVVGAEKSGVGGSLPDLNIGVLGQGVFGPGVVAEGGGTAPSMLGAFLVGSYVVGGVGSTGQTTAVAQEIEAADSSTDGLAMFNKVDGRTSVVLPHGNTQLLAGTGSGGSYSFDINGNETLSGLLFTAGFCNPGCSRPHSQGGHRVVTYSAQTSEPTVEDFGEGRLVGGMGQVKLDPSFARTIDASRSYLVFLTPEGDNRGLFVSQRTASGFTVREAQGGVSTLGFMYRIVAKPYGVAAARLPMVNLTQPSMPSGLHARHIGQMLDPYQELIREVGPQTAAAMVAHFRDAVRERQLMNSRLPHSDANGTLHLGSTTVAPRHINN
jgi:hypothetical protein